MAMYRYAKVGRPYLCLDQSRGALLWYLVAQEKRLCLAQLGNRRGRRKLVGLRALLRHAVKGSRAAPTLELPVFGHVCIPVHRGYKVFNLRRQTVYKVFRDDVEPAVIESESRSAREAAELDFAPRFHGWNAEERWYEEDFFPGELAAAKTMPQEMFLADYHEHVAPLVEAMALLREPEARPFATYASEVASALDDQRLSAPDLDPERLARVRKFVADTLKSLEEERGDVCLVYSHGDFSRENLMLTSSGIKCIDWESGQQRSLLYDAFNYFFTELHYERSKSDMIREVRSALDALKKRFDAQTPALADSLRSHEKSYLQLYYLERIRTFLERELSDDILDVALQSIAAFRAFDEHSVGTTTGA